jgi:DNA-binding MarR family transcriptional regulator
VTPRSKDTFVLDAQLCFALHDASRAMTAAYRPLLSRIGLTYTQYAVMLVLWERRELLFRELTLAVNMDSATLSPLIKRLSANGLVERSRGSEDERTVLVKLTDAGLALQEQARAAQAEVERATGLTRSDLVELREELHELSGRLRAAEIGSLLPS